MSRACPVRDQLIQNYYSTSPVVQFVCTNFATMLNYIQNYTGLNMSNCRSQQTIMNLILVHDTLLVEVS